MTLFMEQSITISSKMYGTKTINKLAHTQKVLRQCMLQQGTALLASQFVIVNHFRRDAEARSPIEKVLYNFEYQINAKATTNQNYVYSIVLSGTRSRTTSRTTAMTIVCSFCSFSLFSLSSVFSPFSPFSSFSPAKLGAYLR